MVLFPRSNTRLESLECGEKNRCYLDVHSKLCRIKFVDHLGNSVLCMLLRIQELCKTNISETIQEFPNVPQENMEFIIHVVNSCNVNIATPGGRLVTWSVFFYVNLTKSVNVELFCLLVNDSCQLVRPYSGIDNGLPTTLGGRIGHQNLSPPHYYGLVSITNQ